MYAQWMPTLKKVKLFEGIEQNELSSMLCCLRPKIVSYDKKDFITVEDHPFTGIGIVISGEVLVTKEDSAGKRLVLAKLKPSQMFGETVAFSGNNHWLATVIAATDCTVLFFTPDVIVGSCPKMCVGHKSLIYNMLKIVSEKALDLNRKIKYLSIKSIRTKISEYLLEQYKISGKTKFTVPLNRGELADFLNVSRPSLSREMIKMKDEGTIDFYKSAFELNDIKTLKSYI